MASSPRHFPLLFLLALLSTSRLTLARQTQFFSKVAAAAAAPSSTEDQVSDNQIQDQPNFIQDSQTGYGLYGHSNGHGGKEAYPTTYNHQTYPTKPQRYTASNNNYEYVDEQQGSYDNQASLTKPDQFYQDSNNNYYNNNNEYANEQQGFGDFPTTYNSQGYVTKPDSYNYNYNNGVDTYSSQQQGQVWGEEKYLGEFNNNKNTNYYNRVNNGYNGQRQGMSDTRFLENGKYYVDVKGGYNYNSNNGYYQNQEYNSNP